MPLRDFLDADGGPGAVDQLSQVAAEAYLEVRTVPADGRNQVTLAVAGEIDSESAPVLQAGLATHLSPHGPDIVVDLTEVSFLNVSGLRVIARAHQQALEGGQLLVVVTGDRHRAPRRALQASGLLDLLTAH
jgi:anti-sigma B factor antagonist